MCTNKYTFHILCRISKEKILKGYHGTKPQNAEDILNNQKVIVTPFKITADVVIPQKKRLPNDLGQGLYLFLDSENPKFDGKSCAKKYAHKWRHKNNKVTLIRFSLNDTNVFAFNLNNPETAERFSKVREKLYLKIVQQLTSSKEDNILKSNRPNIDGIFLEYLFQYGLKKEVDFVIKDTYTPFYTSDFTLSNFANGRELCLRNMEIINWEETKEVK